ncbi:MAG: NADH-quinone oxidoreductase subunit J [Deltaproteobacteria bacterium CG11_big_fil_rev_8_21_14_0_20_47_16]|nr:MAG: NADH-quinone oxidoreductase subunit J [Deltaproteobacteria bacterium CG11_big_fil_rev_8_21_14_0_20_47_16]
MIEAYLFYFFAVTTVLLAVTVVVQPNPIGAAVSLVGTFFSLAALFVLLHAHFVAIMQIILYAGAIMVLFIFVIMLLNLEPEKVKLRTIAGNRLVQGSAALYLAGVIALAFFGWRQFFTQGVVANEMEGTIEAVGKLLLTDYLVPFEMTSVLLLVAIIGAVILARKPVE